MLRLRSDTRAVQKSEFESVVVAVEKAYILLNNLKTQPNYIQQGIGALSLDDLEKLAEKAGEKNRGSAVLTNVDSCGKIIFKVIADIEQATYTIKSIFAELNAEFRARFGQNYNSTNKETGEVNYKAFYDAVNGTLKFKREDRTRSNFEDEVMARARAMAEEMFKKMTTDEEMK
jgi:hypothetical protein